ncbi:hypothetical protein C8Q79DRAFT_1014402 [Trametes meyenii]|nr:hypothetical protein C8Q79DRAFT_1014402 [Trametes meyenii]
MPAFAYGTTLDRLGPSRLARRPSDEDEDYEYYYVGIFVDRDMFMRYLGGGVGHGGAGLEASRTNALHSRAAGAAVLGPSDSQTSLTDDGGGREEEMILLAEQEVEEDEEDFEEFVRPYDDEDLFDDTRILDYDDNGYGHGTGLQGDPEPEWVDGVAGELAEEEDFHFDDVYASEGFAPL